MVVETKWIEKMRFSVSSRGLSTEMDARSPIGSDTALNPKELVAAAIAGCTGMDVVSILRKYKEPLDSLLINTDYTLTEGSHPSVFKSVLLTFEAQGDLSADRLIEAVTLSQTKYCGVSAMIAKAVPIHYVVMLNGAEIARGQSRFE